MNFKKLAETRYSTKQYDASKKVSEELIQELKEILVLSPSSVNSQPWKFVFVSNEVVKTKLSKVSQHNTSKIQEASHLIVFSVIDNLELFTQQVETHFPEEKALLFKNHISKLTQEEIKEWLSRQVYISLGCFLSACASLKIDATPMEGIDQEPYAEILEMKNHKPLFAVCIGYRDSEDYNDPIRSPKTRLPMEDVIDEIR